ncbi:MAG: S41 family peptidase [Bacteroidota bacterium]|nr:S41 family peptidase [Bacteroidota bacterium]
MKRLSYKIIVQYFLISGLLFTGCRKNDPIPEIIPQANEINTFVYNGLKDYYLWNGQIDALSNKKYQDKDSLNAFLNKYTDPKALFTSLLYKYKEIDKWSFLVDNSKTIDDWISGISKTMGYDFMLGRIGSSDNLFGFVRYVMKGSPAEAAGMKRGDIFLNVNDQQLTVSNYQTLLFATETYKLGFATITNNTISPNSRTVNMTAIELQENPINKDTIFLSNNQKIGYLVYNGFNADFDIELNNVFKKFKDANINQLVLDLRYNGGGSVQSSIYLASMIYGTDPSKIFAHAQYNSGVQDYFVNTYGSGALNDYFTSTISATTKNAATSITSLNLQKIYIIVSDNTASASELLINGLKPYMKVTVVGINTVGKYTGSMTVKDWDSNGNVNPNHSWAMQPIIVKYANSNGVSDFINGLTPDIFAEEDIANLIPFGDPNEKLLSFVLADMKGISITGMVLKSAQIGLKKVADSRDFKPFANEMYINFPFRK